MREHIEISLKTFYGRRLSYPIKVNINDLILDLTSKLIIAEDLSLSAADQHWVYNSQYRLITTSCNKIKELHPLKTFAEEEIRDMQSVLLLPQKELLFSEVNLGSNVFLDNQNTSAFKVGSDDLQMVLTDRGFKTGRQYCEFIFDTEPEIEKSIIIGICLTRNDFYFSISDPKGFWGFVPSDTKKIGYNEKGTIEKCEYGSVCKLGDALGILMEFTSKGLNISFFINKVNLGVAFRNLPFQTYYPCAILGYDSSKVSIVSQAVFPDL